MFLLFFKQKTAYEMRISDWSSDVCLPIFGFGEILVDAGEADIGDRVQRLQTVHHHLADGIGLDVRLALGFQLALDAGHEPFPAHGLQRALAAGDPDGTLQLFARAGLALAAFLPHTKFPKLTPPEGGEESAPAHYIAVPANRP